MPPFKGFVSASLLGAATLLVTAPAQAVVYCNTVGLPHGCVVRRPVPAPKPAVVVVPAVRPAAAGPGVGPNLGGPVNRVGLR